MESLCVGILLVPVVLAAWTIGNFRTPVTFPLDAVPNYLAARAWAKGHPDAVYHEAMWLKRATMHPAYLAEAVKLSMPIPDTSFGYNPLFLAFVRPLATNLGITPFLWVTAVMNAIAALTLGYQSARLLTPLGSLGRWLIALAFCVSFPMMYAADLGQNLPLTAPLVLCGFALVSRRDSRQWAGVVLLVLAGIVKPWCVLFLGVLPLLRLWKLSAVAAAVHAAVVWALPALVMPALWRSYVDLMKLVPPVTMVSFNQVSVRSFLARLSWPDWPQAALRWGPIVERSVWAIWLETLIIACVGGLFAWLVWSRRPPVLEAGVCAMAAVLFSLSICWTHYFVFVLPLVVMVLWDASSPNWLRALAAGLALWVWCLMTGSPPKAENLAPPWLWALALNAPLFLSTALALLWLWSRPDGGRASVGGGAPA